MHQLFQNLVGNAIKYHRPGVTPTIEIGCERIDDDWHFSVKDNGECIPLEHHSAIFQAMKRLHGAILWVLALGSRSAKPSWRGTGDGFGLNPQDRDTDQRFTSPLRQKRRYSKRWGQAKRPFERIRGSISLTYTAKHISLLTSMRVAAQTVG